MKNPNSEPLNVLIWQFWTSKIPEIDFMENLRDRKIMKFPHCETCTMLQKLSKCEVDAHYARINLPILLEIIFGKIRLSRIAIFTISEPINFVFWSIWDLEMAQVDKKLKFRTSKSVKNDIFDRLISPKFDFT